MRRVSIFIITVALSVSVNATVVVNNQSVNSQTHNANKGQTKGRTIIIPNRPNPQQQPPQQMNMTYSGNIQVVYTDPSKSGGKPVKKVFTKNRFEKFVAGSGSVSPVVNKQLDGDITNDPKAEHAPTISVKELVAKHIRAIKIRAKLNIETDEDKADLEAASLDALAFIEYQDGLYQIYLIKVSIGNEYFVHVKISALRVVDYNPGNPKGFLPDAENSTLMTVLPNKVDTDKVSREDFDKPNVNKP